MTEETAMILAESVRTALAELRDWIVCSCMKMIVINVKSFTQAAVDGRWRHTQPTAAGGKNKKQKKAAVMAATLSTTATPPYTTHKSGTKANLAPTRFAVECSPARAVFRGPAAAAESLNTRKFPPDLVHPSQTWPICPAPLLGKSKTRTCE